MAPRILCIGDVHLGRRPGRLPRELLREGGLEERDLGPAAALRNAVDEAIRLDVAALLFAGDVVDSANDLFEAFGILQRELARLSEAGIPAYAVAGNHDGRVLPKLAAQSDHLTLVGEGGRWEALPLMAEGQRVGTLVGWSFPRPEFSTSPLPGFPQDLPRDQPVVGLLHADLDASQSHHAPVRSHELAGQRPDAWLLGHIHKPSDLRGDRPLGYLGSLVGLDPGEPGERGAWLAELGPGQRVRLERLHVSPLRWERIDVSIEGVHEDESLLAALRDAFDERLRDLEEQGASDALRAVGARVRLVGRSAHGAFLRGRALHERMAQLAGGERGNTLVFLESVIPAFQPQHDLRELSLRSDPPGLLARDLLALRGDVQGAEARELVHEARATLLKAARSRRVWSELEDPDTSDEAMRERLLRAGFEALDELVAQSEVTP